MSKIQEAAEACTKEVTEIRREIHRHPETSWNEVQTSALIRKKLAEYGVDKIESPVPTAVVALIHGGLGEGKCVALRADIDALPVTEETGLPFASEVPGAMHACGHDMHASMLLGVAKILCGMRDQFRGTVKLIFQHGEELLPGGAQELVKKGVLENPAVDAIFAIHMMPDEDRVGKVLVRPGPLTTSVDAYYITVTGQGGHGSAPHTTDDPLLAACQMVVNMQQIVARRVDPLETAIVSVGRFNSGDAINVIPGEAKFSIVSRTYSEKVREVVDKQVHAIAKGMESISNCRFDVVHEKGYPSMYNDKEMVDLARAAVLEELGPDSVVDLDKPFSFSEDFAYYRQMSGVPSAIFMVCAGHNGDAVYPLHSSKCSMKEGAMPYGMRTLASVALKYLGA